MSEQTCVEHLGDCIKFTYTKTIEDRGRGVTETASMQFPEHSIEGGNAETIAFMFETLKKALNPDPEHDFMNKDVFCLKCGKGHKKGKCADVIIDVGDGRFGVVSDEPATAGPQAFGWRSADSFYPSGFAVGDTVHLIAGKRKYNAHIDIPVGSILTVIEPPNREGWPDDAVQIMFKSGIGAVDASLLRHFRP